MQRGNAARPCSQVNRLKGGSSAMGVLFIPPTAVITSLRRTRLWSATVRHQAKGILDADNKASPMAININECPDSSYLDDSFSWASTLLLRSLHHDTRCPVHTLVMVRTNPRSNIKNRHHVRACQLLLQYPEKCTPARICSSVRTPHTSF